MEIGFRLRVPTIPPCRLEIFPPANQMKWVEVLHVAMWREKVWDRVWNA